MRVHIHVHILALSARSHTCIYHIHTCITYMHLSHTYVYHIHMYSIHLYIIHIYIKIPSDMLISTPRDLGILSHEYRVIKTHTQ